MARIFFRKDNSYQLAHISYLFISLLIVLAIFYFSQFYPGNRVWLPAIAICMISFMAHKMRQSPESSVNIFTQNGNYCYEGKKYSASYLREVGQLLKRKNEFTGVFIGDSSYYKDLYYSRRNPNVYFSPLSYILAGRGVKIDEFCLSDSSAILNHRGMNIWERHYLRNALSRSFFKRFVAHRKGYPREELLRRFIDLYKPDYVLLSKGVAPPSIVQNKTHTAFRDSTTGEQFVLINGN